MKGRRKHQAAKTIQGETAWKKVHISEFGFPYPEQIFELVERWATLFATNPKLGALDPEYLERFGVRYWLYGKADCRDRAPYNAAAQVWLLLGKLRQAIEKGDGDFFRTFANAIERSKRAPIDALRTWLSKRFYLELSNIDGGPSAKGWENVTIPAQLITLKQLHEELTRDTNLRVDAHQLRRACKELGIELAPAKRGRPPKAAA